MGANCEVVTGELLGWVISGACAAPVRGLTAEHVPVQGQVMVSVPAVMTRCKFLIISMGTCWPSAWAAPALGECVCVFVCTCVLALFATVHQSLCQRKETTDLDCREGENHQVLYSVIMWSALAISKANWVSLLSSTSSSERTKKRGLLQTMIGRISLCPASALSHMTPKSQLQWLQH